MSYKSRYFKRKDPGFKEVQVSVDLVNNVSSPTKRIRTESSGNLEKRPSLRISEGSPSGCLESKLSAFAAKDIPKDLNTGVSLSSVDFENRISSHDNYYPPEQISEQKTKRKLTPLEEQVIDLKAKHPNILLMIACGYRYRFFGDEDANAASRVLDISAHQDGGGLGHFLTASVPSFQGPDMYIRKLVAAGFKVGIVTQIDTTAFKKVNSDPSKEILTRKLTGLYTATTLIGNDLKLTNSEQKDERDKEGKSNSDIILAMQENGKGQISMVGIYPMSGDVMYDCFDIKNKHLNELDQRLVILQPREIIVPCNNGKQISHKTREIVESYVHQRRDKIAVRLDLLPNEEFENVNSELIEAVLEPSNNSYLTTLWPNLPTSLSKCFSALYLHLKGANSQSYAGLTPC